MEALRRARWGRSERRRETRYYQCPIPGCDLGWHLTSRDELPAEER